jgi:hypothetical protein
MRGNRAARAGIESFIGAQVAVNYKAGHLVGVLADVGIRGITLRDSGPWRSSVRATRWMPYGAVIDVILASTLPAYAEDTEGETP